MSIFKEPTKKPTPEDYAYRKGYRDCYLMVTTILWDMYLATNKQSYKLHLSEVIKQIQEGYKDAKTKGKI